MSSTVDLLIIFGILLILSIILATIVFIFVWQKNRVNRNNFLSDSGNNFFSDELCTCGHYREEHVEKWFYPNETKCLGDNCSCSEFLLDGYKKHLTT